MVVEESSDQLLPAADLKQKMGKRMPVRTQAKLRAVFKRMAMLEQYPERVVATFRTTVYATLNTSLGQINNGHAGRGHLVQAGIKKPAIPDLRRSAIHEVTNVGAQTPSP